MRITSLDTAPIAELRYLDAGKGAGAFTEKSVPVLQGTVDHLPDGIAALVATADLQGRERFQTARGRPLRLIGETLPAWLEREVFPRLDLPSARHAGAFLAGDFYTVAALDRRGGTGDVTAVWEAFGDYFAWVAGVAGNHDTFGENTAPPASFSRRNLFYLDGEITEAGGLRVAGIGGIIGNPRRPHRREPEDYATLLDLLLHEPVDALLMHDGPDVAALGLRGASLIREMIERRRPALVIRGHAHWERPLVELSNGAQVLNVHERVVILCGPAA